MFKIQGQSVYFHYCAKLILVQFRSAQDGFILVCQAAVLEVYIVYPTNGTANMCSCSRRVLKIKRDNYRESLLKMCEGPTAPD